MAMTLSKLLCEYDIVENVNDRVSVTEGGAGGSAYTITLTAGRYRDHVALCSELQTQINASISTQSWTVAADNTNGAVTITSDCNFSVDWNVASWGNDIRDDLGYDGTETLGASNDWASSSGHLGGLYPTEPIEADDRPETDGADRWFNDAAQQLGRTGVSATKGGRVRISHRTITILLPQSDLEEFEEWMQVAGEGKSFAFYHNANTAWPGSSSEFEEYVLLADEGTGMSYDPERIDPANDIWHRATLQLRKRVASTA